MTKETVKRVLCFLFLCIAFRACTARDVHVHDWQEATCTQPKICATCKATDGEPLGHDWGEASCDTYQTCRVCGKAGGVKLDHSWVDATCTEPERCSMCGKKRHWYSMPNGHKWEDATCTEPKTCNICGVTEGEPEHFFVSYLWNTTIEPTCQTEGEAEHTCMLCDAVETKKLSTIPHKADGWTIIQKATPDLPGIHAKICTMCGIEIEREEYAALPANSSNRNGNGGNFNTYNNEAQQNTSAKYVLNTSSRIFHYPSCRDVPKISPSNYSETNRTRQDLISNGWRSCGHCHS